jgi:hypothetical protein
MSFVCLPAPEVAASIEGEWNQVTKKWLIKFRGWEFVYLLKCVPFRLFAVFSG